MCCPDWTVETQERKLSVTWVNNSYSVDTPVTGSLLKDQQERIGFIGTEHRSNAQVELS